MAQVLNKLSAMKVQKISKPGLHGDGGGLYLSVSYTGGKAWVWRYMISGKAREMGLGAVNAVSLAEARAKAAELRKLKAAGIDPLAKREADEAEAKAAKAAAMTFKEAAERYIAAHRAGWRNAKHASQWTATLATYVYPTIGDTPVADVATPDVTAILEPIWTTKAETAARVRGRIEAVCDYAKAMAWRTGDNPARWKGTIEYALPRRSKVAPPKHHASLPWAELPGFWRSLEQHPGIGALALRMVILTACRTGEAIGATWAEIDLGRALWTVPAARTKNGKEHVVPLSKAALAVLEAAAGLRDAVGLHVFPGGGKPGRPLSNMALLATLRRMGRGDLTSHGFRATFRTWCADTGKPADVAEACLAHSVDPLTAAYRRTDMLDRRRVLLDKWAAYVTGADSVVVPLRA